jgi:hypothetical protein
VDGEVVSGSFYRIDGQLKSERILDGDFMSPAQEFAEGWLPHQCCVMDLAHMPYYETKILEFNCINGSGFYDHDIGKVINQLYEYHGK